MVDLEVLSVGTADDDNLVLVRHLVHGVPTTGEEMIAYWLVLGVRPAQGPQQVKRGGAERQPTTGGSVREDIAIDPELEVSMRTEIRRVVLAALDPAQVNGAQLYGHARSIDLTSLTLSRERRCDARRLQGLVGQPFYRMTRSRIEAKKRTAMTTANLVACEMGRRCALAIRHMKVATIDPMSRHPNPSTMHGGLGT